MPTASYPNFAGKHAGAPVVTTVLEQLAALGTSAVGSVGTAGSRAADDADSLTSEPGARQALPPEPLVAAEGDAPGPFGI